jgi:hypothetical protein
MSEIRKSTAFGSAFFHTPRSLLVALTAWLFALSASAQAQQPAKIRRIGFLTGASYSSQFARNEAFRQGLRDLGYVEGKDIIIEWRSYEGKEDLRPPFAAELVRLNVEVIVAGGAGDVKAAKEASATISIVVLQGGDAIASGFAASLARPGGNITGLSTLRGFSATTHRPISGKERAPGNIRSDSVCGGRRAYVLRSEHYRYSTPGRNLRRQNSKGSQAGGLTNGAADEV